MKFLLIKGIIIGAWFSIATAVNLLHIGASLMSCGVTNCWRKSN